MIQTSVLTLKMYDAIINLYVITFGGEDTYGI